MAQNSFTYILLVVVVMVVVVGLLGSILDRPATAIHNTDSWQNPGEESAATGLGWMWQIWVWTPAVLLIAALLSVLVKSRFTGGGGRV